MRKRKEEVSPEYVREALEYNPETGQLFWKVRPKHHAKNPNRDGYINIFAGEEAFTARHSENYKCGMIDGRQYLAHRVAWAVHYGEWPQGLIDHKNGDKTDNRIDNLRIATHTQNQHNKQNITLPASGFRGVSRGGRGTWRTIIYHNGKFKCNGRFNTPEEAARQYDKVVLFQRGEFAVTNFPRDDYEPANEAFEPVKHVSSSGFKWVYPSGAGDTFYYAVRIKGKLHKKGSFKTAQEASDAVNELVKIFNDR